MDEGRVPLDTRPSPLLLLVPRHSILDTLSLPPSEPTATEAPGATCAGTEAISPAAASTARETITEITASASEATFRCAAKPTGLALAKAIEPVFPLAAGLLFPIGPRCVSSRVLPTAGGA